MLYLAAFFALASSSFAQIETNAEQLKALDWATGSWHHEGVAARDTPHLKRDTKYSKEWKFVWTANKNALLITQLITVDGKPVGQLDSLFGWDKRAEQIVGAGFSTDGGAGRGWTIDAAVDTFTISANTSDWVFEKQEQDRLIVTHANGTKYEYRRLKK